MEDIGEKAASSSGGLQELARCNLANAEGDTHRLLSNKLQLAVPIPLNWATSFPTLRLRDWFGWLLSRNLLCLLVGLLQPDERRERLILRAFWDSYKQVAPNHEVFTMNLPLDKTIPMVFHGDEGRGRRRQGWMVTNFHSLLGRGLQPNLDKQAREGRKSRYLKLKPNYVGHTLTNRFVHAVLPKSEYCKPEVFSAAMSSASSEALYMLHTGVVHPRSGERFHVVTLYLVLSSILAYLYLGYLWVLDKQLGLFFSFCCFVSSKEARCINPVNICP